MSSRGRRIAALAAGAAGTVAAGVVAGALAERRVVRKRRPADASGPGFGTLRAVPRTVVADDGVALHAEVDEPDSVTDEPPIVFVHGYALNLDCWHFQRRHFRGSRRLVFYDHRSHGRSQRSSAEHATVDQLGRDLRTVLDDLVPDGPVILVGHSMGGMTIMALAEQHPELFGERVVGVGLVSTTAGGLRSHAVISPWLPDRLMGQVTPRLVAGLARAPGLVNGARQAGSDLGFLVTGRFAFGKPVPASYIDFVDEMLVQTPFEVLAAFFPNFDALDKFAVLEAFSQVPTTIVCGTADRLTSIDHSRKMAKLVEGAQLVECIDAGHMAILESAEQVNSALDQLAEQAGEHEPTTVRWR